MFRSRLHMLIAQKAHLNGQKITQVDIARETGLARATIGKWMSPAVEMPRIDGNTVYTLCEYLGCDIDDLVEVVPSTN